MIENPLGILLFVDPLQNMDELTVTTVARGLAKVVRVFPPGWQLVFLLHGEDDPERFRHKIPAAGPGRHPGEQQIESTTISHYDPGVGCVGRRWLRCIAGIDGIFFRGRSPLADGADGDER
jgi:hypothetical protein